MYFDGVVYPAPFNESTLSGSTGLLSGLPLGIHNVTIVVVNPFGTLVESFNFTIESPIINPEAICPDSEAVRIRLCDQVTCARVEF